MPYDMLAARDLDDWVQIIIILFVVGGSVFGSIAKKLIEKFSPKTPEQPGRPVPPAPTKRLQRAPSRRAAAPAPPVARPMPPRPRAPVARAAPPRAPEPQRPAIPTAQPVPAARRSVPLPAAEKTAARQPVVTPASGREPQPDTGRRPRRGTRPTSATPSRQLKHLEAAVEDHLKHLESGLEHRSEQLDARVEDHLGHLKPSTEPAAGPSRTTSKSESFARPSRTELRRAVVLREILAPPIALRAPEENW